MGSFAGRHERRLLLATGVWSAGGVILYLLAPMLAPALVLLGVVAPIAWRVVSKGSSLLQRPSALTVVLVLGGIYITLNASWSLSPGDAQLSLVMFLAQVVALHFINWGLAGSDVDPLRAMSIGLVIGTIVGGIALCFDVFSLQWFRRILIPVLPALRPGLRDMAMENGQVMFLQPYLLNRRMAALVFLFWPTMLAVVGVIRSDQRRYLWLAALIPGVAAVAGSVHATSKVALLGSTIAFIACMLWPVLARRAIALGWVLMIVFVVPLASLAYKTELYRASWLWPSAQHRIVIWGHTSRLVAEAPILGAGINTARALNDRQGPVAPGSDFRLSTSLHSHNAYLQTWYETGAVGAALLLAVGLAVIAAIARAPELIQPYLFATFAACALLAGSSFNLWQSWFVASFGLAASFSMAGRWLADRTLNAAGG